MGRSGIALVLSLAAVSAASAAESCAWLNAATAAGALGGRLSRITQPQPQSGDGGICSFESRAGSTVTELRIEVESMRGDGKGLASYLARCHSRAEPLKAIGSEALACSGSADGRIAEQVIGRVRDRAFLVRIATSDRSAQPAALREKAQEIAEQVAGILF